MVKFTKIGNPSKPFNPPSIPLPTPNCQFSPCPRFSTIVKWSVATDTGITFNILINLKYLGLESASSLSLEFGHLTLSWGKICVGAGVGKKAGC